MVDAVRSDGRFKLRREGVNNDPLKVDVFQNVEHVESPARVPVDPSTTRHGRTGREGAGFPRHVPCMGNMAHVS